ncbi:DUF2169 domain-containing protein [Bordetella bronchialis]|uniref:DUF2169 domain-containing protein n=1 Tax=Bordetella bronchialis TaxID=463025 RepID=UPI003CFDAB65
MRVYKPADAMLLLGYQSRGGQPSLTVTVGYCCGPDGATVSEQDTWAWLMPMFKQEPFDLSLKKSRGGYGVAGDACAPAGSSVTGLTVRAGVGELSKSVLVQGDRYWTRGIAGWQASAPQPFERMPLGLERAYGGKGWAANPHGRGHCADADQADGVALPNIDRPEAPVLRPADTPAPAVLGVLPQGSPALARWLGSFDARWQRERLPWLPDDTDPRWFDRFEQDQCRQGYWRGDEPWFAQNMHPHRAEVRGALPGLRPRLLMRTDAAPDQRAELHLDLDTVWLFPNDERVLVLYRAETAVRREDAEDVLGVAVFTEKMADAPQPLEYWARRWQEHDEAQGKPAPAAPPGPEAQARLAAAAEASAAAAKAAEAHRAKIEKTIEEARKSALAEADQHMRAFGKGPLSAKLAKADPQGVAPLPPPPVWPKDPVAFKAAVQKYVADALAAGEAEVRAKWKEFGGDFDAALARAKAQPQVEPDPAAVLAGLKISPEKKQALLKQYEAFQAKIAGVQAQAAEISKKAEALRAQEPPPLPVPEEGMPAGPRALLDRETLLARQDAGESAAWSSLLGLDLSTADLHGMDLSNSVLRGCILRGADLQGANLTGCLIEDCDLDGAQLTKARLERVQWRGGKAVQAQLAGADFTLARLDKAVFTRADLSGSTWTHAQATGCDFEKAVLRQAQGREPRFKACRFAAVDATESRFPKALFDACILQDATLDGAALDGATLTACQAGGARFDGARMAGLRTLKGTSLRQANLNRAQLDRAVLQDTDLGQATLRETRMDRGFLKNCDLSGTDAWHLVARTCDFTGSRIVQASWRGANLMQARLRQVLLQDVDLTGANLHAADTRTATAQGVKLEQALLTRCRLLEDYARG